MTNMVALFPTFIRRAFETARALADADQQRRLERKGFKEMLALDDHMLIDIGVHRGDVEYAAQLPFSENPSLMLCRLSSRSRTRI